MKSLSDQQKGSLLAFVAVMFITPDSLFIRLSNLDTWGLVFYRGIIPFFSVFFGMLLIYKLNFFKILLVFIISFVAFVLIVDTFIVQISEYVPFAEKYLDNLYQSIIDISLFFQNLIK